MILLYGRPLARLFSRPPARPPPRLSVCLFIYLSIYLFQVIGGLFQADKRVILSKENCVQLFAHEAMRVFHDRLVNDNDRFTFCQILKDSINDYFKVIKIEKCANCLSPFYLHFYFYNYITSFTEKTTPLVCILIRRKFNIIFA